LKAATMAAAAVEDPEVVQRVEASLAAVKDEASLKTAAESIAAAAANFAPDNARVAQWRAAHAFYQDFYASRWATLSFSPELPELAAVDHWTREDEHTLSTRGYEELPLETLVQLPAPFELSVQITTLETPEGDSLAGVHLGKVQLAPSTETKGSFFGVNTLTHEYGSRHAYLAKRKLESEQATYELRIRAWPGYHEAFVDGQRVEMRSEVTFEPTTHASLWVGGPPNTTAHVRFANLKLRRLNFEPPPSRRSAPEDRIAYYDARLELEPDNLYHQLDRADALLASGKTDEALADYERLLTKRKDWPHVMAQKGRILVAKGEATEAIALFKKVLESAPVIEAGDTAKTLKIRSDGTVRQPITTGALSHAIAYERLAWLEATSNDAKFRNGKNAVEHAKLAIALSNAEHPEYFLTLAVAYAEARNNAEAKKVLLKAGDLEGLPEQALLEPIQEVLLQKKQFRYPAP
jgi:tetratricopeptide (TPR) repeat protein